MKDFRLAFIVPCAQEPAILEPLLKLSQRPAKSLAALDAAWWSGVIRAKGPMHDTITHRGTGCGLRTLRIGAWDVAVIGAA